MQPSEKIRGKGKIGCRKLIFPKQSIRMIEKAEPTWIKKKIIEPFAVSSWKESERKLR